MSKLNDVLEALNQKLMSNGHAPLSLGQLELINREYFQTVREVQGSRLVATPMRAGEICFSQNTPRFQRGAQHGR